MQCGCRASRAHRRRSSHPGDPFQRKAASSFGATCFLRLITPGRGRTPFSICASKARSTCPAALPLTIRSVLWLRMSVTISAAIACSCVSRTRSSAARSSSLRPFAAATLAGTLIERDELDEADAALQSRTPEPGSEPPTVSWLRLLGIRGRLRLAQGRFEEALESSLSCGARLARFRQPGPATYPWRSEAALALHALGRSDEAAKLAREELERARVFGAPRATGIALRTLGLVEGGKDELENLADAVRFLEDSEGQLDTALPCTSSARRSVEQTSAPRRASR